MIKWNSVKSNSIEWKKLKPAFWITGAYSNKTDLDKLKKQCYFVRSCAKNLLINVMGTICGVINDKIRF